MTVSMENGVGPAPGSPEKQPGSPSPPSIPETGQGATKGEGGTPAPASLPGGSKEEEEKAKRLLYCALCKVAVNSLSQLEAHNKGTYSPSCPCKALSSPTTAPYLPAPPYVTSLPPAQRSLVSKPLQWINFTVLSHQNYGNRLWSPDSQSWSSPTHSIQEAKPSFH